MINPLYSVNISYYAGGDIDHYILATYSDWPTSATYSLAVYTNPYFTAEMPIIGVYATGSDYRTALDNLLISVTASTYVNPGIQPYKRTW